jgi:ribonucleoside-diphosphate reductase alpha chain
MGVLRVDHPDIELFIRVKHNSDKINRFNLSIAITDKFMEAVGEDGDFDLTFEGKVHRTIRAKDLWETIMRSTWDWAEPGVIFIDRINNENNLNYCETITATNPCSEQPLPPFGACLLGSFNAVRYLRPANRPSLGRPQYLFDFAQLSVDIGDVVRAMDNVVDIAMYPLPEQRTMALGSRRMGLGFMGLANAIETMGFPYGGADYILMQDRILTVLMNESYHASIVLAKEKGAFPRYQAAKYNEQPFIQRLSPMVREDLAVHGIRNSHLISMAPTGTISFCMGNVSSGIEPVFAVEQKRIVEMPGGPEQFETIDYAYKHYGTVPVVADSVTPAQHVAVLASAQHFTDSAVSKTCNVPATTPWEDFKDIYASAWVKGAKGCATFTTGGKRNGLLEAKSVADCEGASCALAS